MKAKWRLLWLSLRQRGLLRTIQIVFSTLADGSFDRRYGTDTSSWVELDALEINSKNKGMGVRYVPTRARAFEQVLKTLNLPDDCVFVDLGSGKGRVLMLAAAYPFKRIVGLEFSADLCTIAIKNLQLFKQKFTTKCELQVIQADVVSHAYNDDENVFFMFDPFAAEILEQVMRALKASHQRNPRKIWLIYHNPTHCQIIDKQGWFQRKSDDFFGGSRYLVYQVEK